ncbi:MAG: carbohydrate-binding domain-containing protein, partial [Bacilli bacterium]|nr:carbohydrate-binding domain-containing protein [Bacilli bacterium]
MKKRTSFVFLLALAALASSCSGGDDSTPVSKNSIPSETSLSSESSSSVEETPSESDSSLPGDSSSEASSSEETPSSYDGTAENLLIETEDGTYAIEGNLVKILSAGEYTLSGSLQGMILVDAGEEDEVGLTLNGVSLENTINSPLFIQNASEVKIKAQKGTSNSITDKRSLKTEDDESQGEGAIYSTCDLKFTGKGTLSVKGSYNNGIHGKDDVEFKNQTLTVQAPHHAVKGNDSIAIEEGGSFTFIAEGGDGLHTENSDLSSKGKQRGNITITGGTVNIYSACDGIDASYDAVIQEGEDEKGKATTPTVNIFTNKYSEYTGEIFESSATKMYLKTTETNNPDLRFSVYFSNPQESGVWADAEYLASQREGWGRDVKTYQYYSLDRPSGYSRYQVYRFRSTDPNSTESYLQKSAARPINSEFDTVTITTSGNSIELGDWSNYSSSTQTGGGFPGGPGFPGGFDSGNTDKADGSAKGIKAANQIKVSGGNLSIKAYDDGLHANNGTALENGKTGLGDILIDGGTLNIDASDDGLHADRYLDISGGKLTVEAYEGLEGNQITISGGESYVHGKDDG